MTLRNNEKGFIERREMMGNVREEGWKGRFDLRVGQMNRRIEREREIGGRKVPWYFITIFKHPY